MAKIKALSIVVPVYNEKDNIRRLYDQLHSVLAKLEIKYEILFIDDGSLDGGREILQALALQDPYVKLIVFRRNFGQTAAMSAGFRFAQGEVIISMDADLQNEPNDIPILLSKIKEGFDVVSGQRKNRKDAFFSRRLPSYLANRLISWVSGVRLKDYGCTLKAYRREFVRNIRLYGEMHRFIPIYAKWMGAKIAEVSVNHHPRIYGKSKYGLFRTFKVILDLITVKFLGTFSTKPIYIFGGSGIVFVGLGFLAAVITLVQKFAFGAWVHKNPMILICIFFELVGFQCILMGLLAEIVIRIYHQSQVQPTYWIQETVNMEPNLQKGNETCVVSQDM